MSTDNTEQMRTLLQQSCSRVPASVQSSSVQRVRDWKKNIDKANKVLSNKQSTYQQLYSAYTQLQQYE